MAEERSECRYSQDELTESLWRALASAMGHDPDVLPFAKLGATQQGQLRRVVERGCAYLEGAAGLKWDELAAQLLEYANEGEEPLIGDSPLERVAWQAATRHLASLYFAEDALNVNDLERAWASWVRQHPDLTKEGAA